MNSTIDSFIYIPILLTLGATLILFVLLAICKLRTPQRISSVSFCALVIFVAGLLYTLSKQHVINLVFTGLAIETIYIVHIFVYTFSYNNEKKKFKSKQNTPEENVVDTESLRVIEDNYKGQLKLCFEITNKASNLFKAEEPVNAFLEYLSKLYRRSTKADGCIILVYDGMENVLKVRNLEGAFPPPYKLPDDIPHKQIRVETNLKFQEFGLKGNIFGDIFTNNEIVNITEPLKDSRIFQNGEDDFLKVGPYLFLPIEIDGEAKVLVALSKVPEKSPFTDEDINEAININQAVSLALKPLSCFMSYAEHAELTKAGDIASKFQNSLVPQKLPVINKLSIGKYSSNTDNVCGDYYDVIPSRKDRITFVMADVAGKGMNSLVVMVMIRAMLRLIANTNSTSAKLLEWINKAICSEKNSMDQFASISLINYDSINNKAQISSCGINPVMLYSVEDGSVKKITTDCEPIGVEKNTIYKNYDLELKAGDILFTCTDGLIECLNDNGVQYSIDKLSEIIKANARLSGKDIASKVKDDVKKFTNTTQQYDDQSLLVIKIQG